MFLLFAARTFRFTADPFQTLISEFVRSLSTVPLAWPDNPAGRHFRKFLSGLLFSKFTH